MIDYQQTISDADWIGHDDGPDTEEPLKLSPCPFCGGQGKVIGNVDHGPFFVMCFDGCGCTLGMHYDFRNLPEHRFQTRELAAEAWNSRRLTAGQA